jgi:hypothetical protein
MNASVAQQTNLRNKKCITTCSAMSLSQLLNINFDSMEIQSRFIGSMGLRVAVREVHWKPEEFDVGVDDEPEFDHES